MVVDYEIKDGELVIHPDTGEAICGPETIQLTCKQYRKLTGHPYNKPEFPEFNDDEQDTTLDDIKDCLTDIEEALELSGCIESDFQVICGPQFGCTIYNKPGEPGFFYFDPDSGEFLELDTVSNEMGKPASTITDPSQIAGVSCYYENITASVCNDNPDADMELTAEDILALVTGEVFNNPTATAVDLSAPGQELIFATVNSWLQNSTVKKGEEDFTVTTAAACANSVGGEKYNLQSGGAHDLGDSHGTLPDQPIVIDESVTIPCGSAVRFCFRVRYCEFDDGSPVVEKEGGGFVKGEG